MIDYKHTKKEPNPWLWSAIAIFIFFSFQALVNYIETSGQKEPQPTSITLTEGDTIKVSFYDDNNIIHSPTVTFVGREFVGDWHGR